MMQMLPLLHARAAMRRTPVSLLVALAALSAACASAAPAGGYAAANAGSASDRAAVAAAVDRLFDAMRTRDTTAIRALVHPELRLFVPGEQNGRPTVRVTTADDFVRGMGTASQVYDERAFDPEIRIDGNLATVWTYYEFRIDGAFSHCGIDAFHFARTAAGWQIIGLAYTTRQDGCR
jgi:hypothetical protein